MLHHQPPGWRVVSSPLLRRGRWGVSPSPASSRQAFIGPLASRPSASSVHQFSRIPTRELCVPLSRLPPCRSLSPTNLLSISA